MFFSEIYWTELIICIIILHLILFLYLRKNKIQINKENRSHYFITILTICYCSIAVHDTDYFHYIYALENVKKGLPSSLEDFYIYIARLVNYHYLLFRILIWGAAYILFFCSIKRLSCDEFTTLFFFITVYFLTFSYARVSLAMSAGLFGYSFIIKPFKPVFISIGFGIIILYASLFLHKSAGFMIPIYIASLVTFTKIRLFILLLIFPFLSKYISEYLYVTLITNSNESISYVAQNYFTAKDRTYGISGYIRLLLNRTPYYLFLISFAISIFTNAYQKLKFHERSIVNSSFLFIYSASFFLVSSQYNMNVFYYRLLYFSILTASISLSIFLRYNITKNIISTIIIIGGLGTAYNLLYTLYVSLL